MAVRKLIQFVYYQMVLLLTLLVNSNDNSSDFDGFASTRSIFGNDDRREVSYNEIQNDNWAKRTVLIKKQSWNPDEGKYAASVCTGTMVSLNTVLTAGHCITNRKKINGKPENETEENLSKDYYVVPGGYMNSDGDIVEPYGSYSVDMNSVYTDSSWLSYANPNQDWGILKLTENIPDEIGYYDVLSSNRDDISGMPIRLSGYPSDKSNERFNIGMWTSTGNTLNTSYIDNWNSLMNENGLYEFNYSNIVHLMLT